MSSKKTGTSGVSIGGARIKFNMGPKMGQEEVKREIGRIWSKSAMGGLEVLVHPNYCVIRNWGECTF